MKPETKPAASLSSVGGPQNTAGLWYDPNRLLNYLRIVALPRRGTAEERMTREDLSELICNEVFPNWPDNMVAPVQEGWCATCQAPRIKTEHQQWGACTNDKCPAFGEDKASASYIPPHELLADAEARLALRSQSTPAPAQPWGDEPWDEYLERQREKARHLQKEVDALKEQLATPDPALRGEGAASLRDYLQTTPPEQLAAEWKEVEAMGLIGPTLSEVLHGTALPVGEGVAAWHINEELDEVLASVLPADEEREYEADLLARLRQRAFLNGGADLGRADLRALLRAYRRAALRSTTVPGVGVTEVDELRAKLNALGRKRVADEMPATDDWVVVWSGPDAAPETRYWDAEGEHWGGRYGIWEGRHMFEFWHPIAPFASNPALRSTGFLSSEQSGGEQFGRGVEGE